MALRQYIVIAIFPIVILIGGCHSGNCAFSEKTTGHLDLLFEEGFKDDSVSLMTGGKVLFKARISTNQASGMAVILWEYRLNWTKIRSCKLF
jgi:hypothetical protein